MEDNEFISDTTQIWFTYAWVPQNVALNNLSNSEKNKVIKFLENGLQNIRHIETKNEIKSIINFIRTDSTTDFENVGKYTRLLDRLNHTDYKKLNGINFENL